MDTSFAWFAAAATVVILLLYEATVSVTQRRRPHAVARAAHAGLREQWFAAVSAQAGSEILAVQTLRNAVMSASMTASTAALGLMGAVALAVPSLPAGLQPRLAMELVLLALLFASLVCSVMAVRYYNHASFIGGMPVESQARKQWNPAAIAYVRRAGVLYGWGLRSLVLVAAPVAFLLHPTAGPLAGLIVVGVLWKLDQPGSIAGNPDAAQA